MGTERLRLRIFIVLVVVAIGLLTARLIHLQVINREYYAGESEKNAVRLKVTQSARGLIFDRNGRLLVDNVPTYSLTVTPRYFDEDRIPLLAELLEVPDSTVIARLNEAHAWSPYQASRIFREVPFHVFSRIQEHLYQLPGIEFIVDDKRHYHGNVRASHIFGYVKEISQRQLEARKESGYRQGDRLGQTGLERSYESQLRGESGRRFMMVNVYGQEVKSYHEGSEDVPPQSGANLTLTIDAKLQALAERLYENKRGGAVVLDPNNGEILALVSSPDYDPRLLSGSVSRDVWEGLQEDPFKPLFNRATMSGQPPGSTFKPFMALVGLQDGVITPQTTVTCNGVYYYGRPFKCHGVHGTVAVRDAIKYSCNVFFFTLMMRLNFDRWSQWGPQFGFGVETPTDLPEVVSGLIPDSAYFDHTYPRGWTRGYLVSLGIGQGDMVITPLQLARYAAALANGGTLVTPHVVRSAVDPQTGEHMELDLEPSHRIPIKPEHFVTVREGMRRMAMENNSTARWGDVVLAGKTGTAQNPHGKDHSWFLAFAPFDHPQIALAVLVENAGFGATVASPMAGLLMEQYLDGTIDKHPQFVRDMAFNSSSEGMEHGEGMKWRHFYDDEKEESGQIAVGMAR